jgi:cation diffusion facilitator CzcD-associated flavoprotein CzcO
MARSCDAADVLVIGAGASATTLNQRLSARGFRFVCFGTRPVDSPQVSA